MAAPADNSALIWAFADSGLAIVMFFVFGGLGFIFGIFGVINAFRAKANEHPLAPVAIGVSLLALLAVIVGWIVKLSNGGSF